MKSYFRKIKETQSVNTKLKKQNFRSVTGLK